MPVYFSRMTQRDGLWTIRVGLFGAPDSETRGGVVAIEDGRIVGGDSNLAYFGECTGDSVSLAGRLHLIRHGDPSFVTVFGRSDPEYDVEFVAERLGEGYYEGRLLVRPNWQGRLVLRRLSDLPARAGYSPRAFPSPSLVENIFYNASKFEQTEMTAAICSANTARYMRN